MDERELEPEHDIEALEHEGAKNKEADEFLRKPKRSRGKEERSLEEKEGKTMNEDVKCPKCGAIMEEGYVKMNEGIRWRTRDDSRGELLRLGTFFWPRDYAARLCRNCKWILISYHEGVKA